LIVEDDPLEPLRERRNSAISSVARRRFGNLASASSEVSEFMFSDGIGAAGFDAATVSPLSPIGREPPFSRSRSVQLP
jgi:hypothetical protein